MTRLTQAAFVPLAIVLTALFALAVAIVDVWELRRGQR